MGVLGVMLSVAPARTWSQGLRRAGLPESRPTVWLQSEMLRHSARDITEAGRDLGRFDSRPWLGSLRMPVAVVITTRDDVVPPQKQRELARAASAKEFEAPVKHLGVVSRARDYNPALLRALEAVGSREGANAAYAKA